MMARRIAPVLLSVLVSVMAGACSARPAQPAAQPGQAPRRIVSLDYCADQYVLRFARREDILALSPDAGKSFSYLRASAAGLRQVRPRTADVIALRPDLVVRSYGGGPGIEGALGRAGVPVLQVGYPDTLAAIRAEAVRMGAALGAPEQGQSVAADMDRRLAALAARPATRRTALYTTPGGVTTGPGTLVHDMLVAAGLTNFQTRPGWNPLPLERLAYQRPDVVAASFVGADADYVDGWNAARHPVVTRQLAPVSVVAVDGAWTACGGWFVVDAVEALARAGKARP